MSGQKVARKCFVKYSIESCLTDSEFSGLLKIEGLVIFSNDTSSNGEPCGRVKAHVIKASDMLDHGFFDVDAWNENQELSQIVSVVYSADGSWSDKINDLWASLKNKDVFVIEEIFIDKKYRGYDFGLAIAERTISLFARECAIVVVSPWPTEIEDKENEDLLTSAHKKLAKHCERLGFENIVDTDLWVRSLEHPMERITN